MLKKYLQLSVLLITIVSALRAAYGLIFRGGITYNYVLMASFWVGAFLIASGILLFITPAGLALLFRRNRLVDSTTYGEKVVEERETRNVKAYEHIFIGIGMISITGMIQFAAWLIF